MNILFIDCETSGLDPAKNAMLEFAAELHVDGVKVSEFSTGMYDRRSPVSLGALKVNGLKLAGLLLLKNESEAVVELIDWLLSIKVQGPIYVCGHNVHFDISFLKALLAKYQLDGLDNVIGYHFLDTFSIGSFLMSTGKLQTENNKVNLSALAKGLGLDVSQYKVHTATEDVRLTVDVYNSMVKLLQGA